MGFWRSPRWFLLEAPLASPPEEVRGAPRRPNGAARAKALEAIRSAKLPARRPDGIWGGSGQDAPCAICGVPVRHHEVELELEFMADAGSRKQRHHVHPGCFAAWEREVRRLERADLPESPDVGNLVRRAPDRLDGGAR